MHIVIDTNIFVSGLLGSKFCRRIFALLKTKDIRLIISDIILEELCFVLERPKFHLLITREEAAEVISLIKRVAIFVKPEIKIEVCRDIKDNKVIECAITGKADFILTSDKDLLTLKSFQQIPIIKPQTFLHKLSKGNLK